MSPISPRSRGVVKMYHPAQRGDRMCPIVSYSWAPLVQALSMGERVQLRTVGHGHKTPGPTLFSRPARIFSATDGHLRWFAPGATTGTVAEVFFIRLNKIL